MDFHIGRSGGQGTFAERGKTLAELKNQIQKLQEMVGKKDTSELEEIKALQKDSKFAFYDALSSKKAPAPPVAQTPQPKSPKPTDAKSESVKKPDTPSPDAGQYVVQVASLDQEKEALKMVNRLKNKGYPAYQYKIFIKGRSYYRVRCGTFKSRAEAVETQKTAGSKRAPERVCSKGQRAINIFPSTGSNADKKE
jgi:cell division septation protein DedD